MDRQNLPKCNWLEKKHSFELFSEEAGQQSQSQPLKKRRRMSVAADAPTPDDEYSSEKGKLSDTRRSTSDFRQFRFYRDRSGASDVNTIITDRARSSSGTFNIPNVTTDTNTNATARNKIEKDSGYSSGISSGRNSSLSINCPSANIGSEGNAQISNATKTSNTYRHIPAAAVPSRSESLRSTISRNQESVDYIPTQEININSAAIYAYLTRNVEDFAVTSQYLDFNNNNNEFYDFGIYLPQYNVTSTVFTTNRDLFNLITNHNSVSSFVEDQNTVSSENIPAASAGSREDTVQTLVPEFSNANMSPLHRQANLSTNETETSRATFVSMDVSEGSSIKAENSAIEDDFHIVATRAPILQANHSQNEDFAEDVDINPINMVVIPTNSTINAVSATVSRTHNSNLMIPGPRNSTGMVKDQRNNKDVQSTLVSKSTTSTTNMNDETKVTNDKKRSDLNPKDQSARDDTIPVNIACIPGTSDSIIEIEDDDGLKLRDDCIKALQNLSKQNKLNILKALSSNTTQETKDADTQTDDSYCRCSTLQQNINEKFRDAFNAFVSNLHVCQRTTETQTSYEPRSPFYPVSMNFSGNNVQSIEAVNPFESVTPPSPRGSNQHHQFPLSSWNNQVAMPDASSSPQMRTLYQFSSLSPTPANTSTSPNVPTAPRVNSMPNTQQVANDQIARAQVLAHRQRMQELKSMYYKKQEQQQRLPNQVPYQQSEYQEMHREQMPLYMPQQPNQHSPYLPHANEPPSLPQQSLPHQQAMHIPPNFRNIPPPPPPPPPPPQMSLHQQQQIMQAMQRAQKRGPNKKNTSNTTWYQDKNKRR